MKPKTLAACAILLGLGTMVLVKTSADAQREQRRQRARRIATQALGVLLRDAGHAPPSGGFFFETGGQRNAWFDSARDAIGIDLDWVATTIDRLCGDLACAEDFSVGVLAHELGHALDPWLHVTSRWSGELRADAEAGRTLALLGRSPEPLVRFLAAGDPNGSPSHPPAWMRIGVVLESYRATLLGLAA